MVLPVPMNGFAGGRPVLPTSIEKTMYWLFGIFIGLEFGLCALRFYFVDIWGGVIMTLIGVFGIFVMKYAFDIQWVVMFGITIFFYGLIHFVMMLERVIIGYADFLAIEDARSLIRDIVFIAAPVVDWTLMGLCIYMYRKMATGGESAASSWDERRPLNGGGAIPSGGSIGSTTSGITRQGSSTFSRQSSFTPFSGTGRKLA